VQVQNEEHHLLWGILSGLKPSQVTEGGATGADTVAYLWAVNHNTVHYRFPAEWDRYGRAAGTLRNQQMLDEADHDLVVAVHRDWSRNSGTLDMVKRCEKIGLPVFRVESPLGVPEAQLKLL
jgi:hypothetical protein